MKRSMKKKTVILLAVIIMLITVPFAFPLSSSASELAGIWNGKVYNITSYLSGKYLQAYGGVDANNTNINQWTADGSVG